MKTYKKVILGILMLLSLLPLMNILTSYSAGYVAVMFLLIGIGFWFNWNYAGGEWPNMSYLQACGIALGLAAGGVYISVVALAQPDHRRVGEVVQVLFESSPQVYFQPFIITPISLLIWRWLFKEPRLARQSAVTTITTTN